MESAAAACTVLGRSLVTSLEQQLDTGQYPVERPCRTIRHVFVCMHPSVGQELGDRHRPPNAVRSFCGDEALQDEPHSLPDHVLLLSAQARAKVIDIKAWPSETPCILLVLPTDDWSHMQMNAAGSDMQLKGVAHVRMDVTAHGSDMQLDADTGAAML